MSPSKRVTDQEIEAWVNGELPEADRERVVAAVMTDPHAEAQLDECLQLRALGARVGEAAPDARSAPARARPRRPWRLVGSFGSFGALAATLALVCIGTRARIDTDASNDRQVVAALDPHRRIEARLSWSTADGYRGYDTDRAADPRQVEPLSFALLGQIERRNDPRALVAAHLLVGNVDRARQELERAPDTADTWSDRAAIALLAKDHERALHAADQALARTGDHAQAQWNRALALSGLGLDRSAAAVFAQIAQRGEVGWSVEAAARATVLADRRARSSMAWTEASAAAGRMVRGGPPALEYVDAYPVLLRLSLYEAVRVAPSPARVRALEPLARALDARTGSDVLVRHVNRVAALPFTRRAGLAARYANLVAGALSEPLRAELMRDLRSAAGETADLLLGALPLAGPLRGQILPGDTAEYGRLAEATEDPWFALLASEQRALLALTAGDLAGAASQLRPAAERCARRDAVALRCYQIARLETYTDLAMHRLKAASEAWAHAWKLVGGTAMTPLEDDALQMGVTVANLRDDTGGTWLGLAKAYLDEWAWSKPSCAAIGAAREDLSQSLINQSRTAEAKALIDEDPDCRPPFTTRRAFVLAQLIHDPAGVAALRREISTLRAAPSTTAGDRALLDHSEGRVLIAIAPDEGRALLHRVIADAAATRNDPTQAKARGYSYSVLVQEAARRGGWSEVLSLLAEERGAPPPERCALGAAEEEAAVFVARGRDGSFRGAYLRLARGQPAGEVAVPSELRAMFAGCDVVEVYARSPYYGRAGLLAPGTALRFRSGGGTPRPPGPGPVVVIGNISSPAELHLAPLQPIASSPGTVLLDGASATPSRALAAMRTASFVEVHVHGLVGIANDDAAILVLAPEADGRYALTASDVAGVELVGHPVVVLAACEAASASPAFHVAWGLADAFLGAGANAVIASQGVIGDAAAPQFFAGVRRRIQAGSGPASALRDERDAWRDPTQRRWIDQLVVFQ
jgi:cellulose synthase operon protein C